LALPAVLETKGRIAAQMTITAFWRKGKGGREKAVTAVPGAFIWERPVQVGFVDQGEAVWCLPP
jgi:hypothetical protein